MATNDSNANLPDDIATLSYEQAIAALEAIIDKIESGEIGLEDSVKAYERGRLLKEHCRRILDRAEKQVSELTPNGTDADESSGAAGAV
ncbi:MAG: exodeoxyribonuclease VII small subunit [Phycisphaerales bacterium]|nr:exodeoxyribonuclease VII small subunit [Phycisphaerales bacterium]